MLTKTISQLSAASSITDADYFEVEQSGVSKYATIQMVGDALVATSSESLLGSSNSVLITPATLRAGMNAETAAPMYACRAWASFDTTTISSSITGTYVRASGTTLTTITITAHSMITGNRVYIEPTSGGASQNTYTVAYISTDTFSINTVSTSSAVGSCKIYACPRGASGNINYITRETTGQIIVNFAVAMPSIYYAVSNISSGQSAYYSAPTAAHIPLYTYTVAGANTDYTRNSLAVFA